MEKAAIRRDLQEKLEAMPPLIRAQEEELVNAMLLEAFGARGGLVGVYKAIGTELSLVSFCNALFRDGVAVAFPRVNDEGMEFGWARQWSDLRPGRFGIPEPIGETVVPDWLVVPGVGWMQDGSRLGRGGGVYDRFLAAFKGAAVGACFDCQVVPSLPLEPHDVPVSKVFHQGSLFA